MVWTYTIIAAILLAAELCYFKIADHFNIIDKPNERSSHSRIVLRGGGIIFAISILVWMGWQMVQGEWSTVQDYLPFIVGLVLICAVSFWDDVHSLPDSVRLVVQFVAMFLVLYGFMFHDLWFMALGWYWKMMIVAGALIVCVGATNIYNFMDGINGITGGYSLAMLIPLLLLNKKYEFMDEGLLVVVVLSVLVFCLFNFRTKAKCFAGDVGSIGMALILTFCVGRLMMVTGDVAWIVLFLIYGVDGVLTICHRIMLHENLGQAHRKHAYQLMANELKMPHVVVSSIYMVLQLAVSLVAIYLIPDTVAAHWIYLVCSAAVMGVAYILFMRKYYHLHEEYIESLKSKV